MIWNLNPGRLWLPAAILLVASCGGAKLNTPGPETPTALVLPVELDAVVVTKHHFYYYKYEIGKADDASFTHEVAIKFPVKDDMLVVDTLAPGDYLIKKLIAVPIGPSESALEEAEWYRDDGFTLEYGKITVFSQSLKVVMRNLDKGRFDTIRFNYGMVPVTSEQRAAITATLSKLPNYGLWKN